MVAAIEVASRTKPAAEIGKPGPLLLQEAAKAVGLSAAGAIMIGDAPTDIQAARAVGAQSILMLTGVTSPDRAAGMAPQEAATMVAADAGELARALVTLAGH